MKMRSSKVSILLLIGVLVTIGCSTEIGDQPDGGDSEFLVSVATSQSEMITEEAPLEENVPPNISDQAYISQSGAFKIMLPEAWNCSETGEFQVNCQAPDQSAQLQAEITATGYELDQTAFLTFTHAELVHAYSEVKEYVEQERLEEEGQLVSVAAWRDGNVYWQSTDMFQRKNGTVFHLMMSIQDSISEKYTHLFTSINESIEIIPSDLRGVQLYAKRVTHTALDSFFEVDVPTSWGRYMDAAAVERTRIEGFLSPDKRAAVQIAVYNRGSLIEKSLKAEKTREIIRTQNGYDLRYLDDKPLPDGRERLTWYAENKGINGISFFDSYGSSLYVFSIVWEESTAYLYQPILEEIAASFNRE
ncbi:MAG: hypothetical protein Q7J07_08670 [Pelolinea sp.]|nr:hypothetical protein [Pelolinea sp.]